MQLRSNTCDVRRVSGIGDTTDLRILLVIACYGTRNLDFLRSVIRGYQRMNLQIDIAVLSEAPKSLDSQVKVVVGLPAKNPWTLPFAHKKVFADNIDRYDLFIYSEDDIEITEDQIRSFLRITPHLQASEIAGYVRYETADSGDKILTDVHWAFHWKAGSVRQRGPYTVAEITNEHAGFYILTQEQLRRAIRSGGFLRAPYEARYGFPETAATDPYTSCGFHKVVCISHFDDFLIRHMSNLYAARHGLPLSACRKQIETLFRIADGDYPATTLCEVEPRVLQRNWSKSFFERAQPEVLRMMPSEGVTVLSVGVGWGEAEDRLRERGHKVTVLPLNSVVGADLIQRGFEVINGSLLECALKLRGRQFDCILLSNLIHLLPNPWAVLRHYAQLVRTGGTFVISGYNFSRLPVLLKRICMRNGYSRLYSFEQCGIHPLGVTTVKRQLSRLGFVNINSGWFSQEAGRRSFPASRWFPCLANTDWVIRAESNASAPHLS